MHDMEVIRKHMQDPSRRRSAQAEKSKVLEAFASKALALRVSLEQKVAELNSSYQKRAEGLGPLRCQFFGVLHVWWSSFIR